MTDHACHRGCGTLAFALVLALGASASAQQRVSLEVRSHQDSTVSSQVNLSSPTNPNNLHVRPKRFQSAGSGLTTGGQFNSLRQQMDLARIGPTQVNDTRYQSSGSSVSAYALGSPYRLSKPYQVTLPAHLDPKSYSGPSVPMSPYRNLKSLSPYAGL